MFWQFAAKCNSRGVKPPRKLVLKPGIHFAVRTVITPTRARWRRSTTARAWLITPPATERAEQCAWTASVPRSAAAADDGLGRSKIPQREPGYPTC